MRGGPSLQINIIKQDLYKTLNSGSAAFFKIHYGYNNVRAGRMCSDTQQSMVFVWMQTWSTVILHHWGGQLWRPATALKTSPEEVVGGGEWCSASSTCSSGLLLLGEVEDLAVGLPQVLLLFEVHLKRPFDGHKGDATLQGNTSVHSLKPSSRELQEIFHFKPTLRQTDDPPRPDRNTNTAGPAASCWAAAGKAAEL